MSNKNYNHKNNKIASDPSSPNYTKQINNKEHSKSQYGNLEPSTHTTYK